MADSGLFYVAEALLTTTAASLDDPPDRLAVVGGPSFARDCDQVVVFLASVTPSRPAQRISADRRVAQQALRPAMLVANYVVAITRTCYPVPAKTGPPPKVEAIMAATDQLLTDGRDAWSGLYEAARAGTLFASVDAYVEMPPCAGVQVGDITARPQSPTGASIELQIPIAVNLN